MSRFVLIMLFAGLLPVVAQEAKPKPPQPVTVIADQDGWSLRVTASPDGTRLVTSASGKPRGYVVWAGLKNTLRPVNVVQTPDRPWSLSYHPNGKQILVGGGRNVGVWQIGPRDPVVTIPDHTSGIWGAAFVNGGSNIVSACWSRRLRFFSSEGKLIASHRLPRPSRCLVEAGPDEVALGLFDKEQTPAALAVMNVRTGQTLHLFEGHSAVITGISVCPTNRNLIATSSADRTVRIWDRRTGKVNRVLAGHGGFFKAWVEGVSFTADGRYLASCADSPADTVFLWDVATGHLHWKSEPMGGAGMLDVAAIPGGDPVAGYQIATVAKDGKLRVWTAVPDPDLVPIDLAKALEQIRVLGAQVQAKAEADEFDGAVETGEIVMTLWKNLEDIFPSDYANFLEQFGDVHQQAEDFKASAGRYEAALTLRKSLSKTHPAIERLRKKLGFVYALDGQTEKAKAFLLPERKP